MEESRIVPSLVEDGFPVVHEVVGGGVAVELRGHRFNDEPDVNQEGLKGAFGDLIGEGALVDGHGCLDLGVTGGEMASHHDRHEIARDEAHFLDFVHDWGARWAVDWRSKSEGVKVGKERSRRKNVERRFGPKGMMVLVRRGR